MSDVPEIHNNKLFKQNKVSKPTKNKPQPLGESQAPSTPPSLEKQDSVNLSSMQEWVNILRNMPEEEPTNKKKLEALRDKYQNEISEEEFEKIAEKTASEILRNWEM